MAIKKPGVQPTAISGVEPVAPSIRFAADQLIRKTKRIVGDVQRAYIGIFSYIRLLDTDATPSTQIRISNVDGTLSIYGDPEATAQISLFIKKCLWISNGTVLFQSNSGVISLGDVDNFDVFLRATRQGANDYKLEAEIDGAYKELEHVVGSQAKVDTHAAKTGDTHGLGPTADFESVSGAQTKVNTHAALSNAHGAAIVADDTRVGCKAWNSGNVSIPDSTNTAITLDSEEYDTDTIHSTASNTSRLTCVTAGLYMVTSTVVFAANATGVRQIMLWMNGDWAQSVASHKTPAAGGGVATEVTISALVDLAVDEYVEVYAFQNSGAALNVTNYLHFPHLAMQRLSA